MSTNRPTSAASLCRHRSSIRRHRPVSSTQWKHRHPIQAWTRQPNSTRHIRRWHSRRTAMYHNRPTVRSRRSSYRTVDRRRHRPHSQHRPASQWRPRLHPMPRPPKRCSRFHRTDSGLLGCVRLPEKELLESPFTRNSNARNTVTLPSYCFRPMFNRFHPRAVA